MASVQLSLPFHVISKLSDEEKCKIIVQQCILLQVDDWEIRCLLQLCSKKGKVSEGMTLVYRYAGLIDEIREEISELMEVLVTKAFSDSIHFQFPLSGGFHRELLLSLLRLISSLSEWRKLQWMPRPILFDDDGSLITLSTFFERLVKYFTITLKQQTPPTHNEHDFKNNLSFLIHSCNSTYFELDSVDLSSVLQLISDVMEMEQRIEHKWQDIITLPAVKFPLATFCLPYPSANQFIEQNRWFMSTFPTYSTIIGRIEDILLHVFNFYNRTNQINFIYNSLYSMRNSKVVGEFFSSHAQRNVSYLSERNAFSFAAISPLTLRSSWIPHIMSSSQQIDSAELQSQLESPQDGHTSEEESNMQTRTTNDLHAPPTATTIEAISKFTEEESTGKVDASLSEEEQVLKDQATNKAVEVVSSLQSSPTAAALQHRSTITVTANDPVIIKEPALFQRRSNSTVTVTPQAPRIIAPIALHPDHSAEENDDVEDEEDFDSDNDNDNEEIIYYVRYDPKRDRTPEQAIETMLKAANSNDSNDFSRPRSLSNYAATPTNNDNGNYYSGRIVRNGNNNRPRVYSADSYPVQQQQQRPRHSGSSPDHLRQHSDDIVVNSANRSPNRHHGNHSPNFSPNFSGNHSHGNTNSNHKGMNKNSSSRPSSFTSRRKVGSDYSAYSLRSNHHYHSPPSSGVRSGWSARQRLRGIDFSAQSLASALRSIDELDESDEDRAARKIGLWFKLIAPRRKLLRRLSHRDLMADVINLLLDKTVQKVTIREKRRHRLLRHGAAIKVQKCYRQWQQYMLEQERIQEQNRRTMKAWQLLDELRRSVKNAIRIQRYIKYAIRKKLIKDRKRGRIPPTIGEIINLYMMQFVSAKRAGLYQNLSKRLSRGQSLLQMEDTRRKDAYRNLDRAATRIQTIYRGSSVRKRIARRKLELFMTKKLRMFITGCIRKRRARRNRLIFKSSTVIQKFFRGIHVRRKLFRIVHSGLALNKLWRKHQAYRGLKSQLRRLDRPITIMVHGLRDIPKKSLLTDELHVKVSVWWNPLLHIMSESDSIEITLTKSPQYIYTGECHKVTTEDAEDVPELAPRGRRVFESVISQAGRFVYGMRQQQSNLLRNSGSNSPPPSRLDGISKDHPAAPSNDFKSLAKVNLPHDRHNTAPAAMVLSPPSSVPSSPQILSVGDKSGSKKGFTTTAPLPPVRAPPAAVSAAAMMVNNLNNNNGGMMRPKTVSFDGGRGGGGSGKLNPLPQIKTSPSNGSGKSGILKKQSEPRAMLPSSSAKVAVTRERHDSSTSSDEEKKNDELKVDDKTEVKAKPKFDPKAGKLLSSHIKRRLSMKLEAAKLLKDPNYVKKTDNSTNDAIDQDDDDHDDDNEEDTEGKSNAKAANIRFTAMRQAMTFAFGLSNMAKKTAMRKRTKLVCNFEDETLKIPGCHGNSVIKFEIFDGERKLSSTVFQLRKEGGMLYWGGEYTRSCSILHQRRAIQFNANIIQPGAAHGAPSMKGGASMLLDFRVVAGAPLRSKCGWARLLCRGKGPLKRALKNRDFMASFSLFDQWNRFYCSLDEFGLFLFNNKYDTQAFFSIPAKELLRVVVDSNGMAGATESKSIVEDLNNVIVKTQLGDELCMRFPDSASRNSWTEVLQNTIAYENRNGKVKRERSGGPRTASWLPFANHLPNTNEESDDERNSSPPPPNSGESMSSPVIGGSSSVIRSGKHLSSGCLSTPSAASSSNNIMASPNVVNRKQRTPPIFSVPFKQPTENNHGN